MSNQFVRLARPRTITLANPEPGDDAIFTVPSGVLWRLRMLTYALSTEAVIGATKAAVFIYREDTTSLWTLYSDVAMGAGLVWLISLGVGVDTYEATVAGGLIYPVPPFILRPTDTIYCSQIPTAGTNIISFPILDVQEQILGY